MDARLLRRCFLPGPVGSSRDTGDRRSSTITDASEVVTRDDLAQPPSFNMSYLNEPRVEYKDVWGMPCDVLGSAFPLDGPFRATWVTVVVYIQSEF